MGIRQQRLGDEIRDIVAGCFQAGVMHDPRLEQVTITGVKLSPDLQVASIYYRVYQDEHKEKAKKGLEAASGFLKTRLADNLDVRRIPQLRFFYDESIEHGSRIEGLLRDIKEEE